MDHHACNKQPNTIVVVVAVVVIIQSVSFSPALYVIRTTLESSTFILVIWTLLLPHRHTCPYVCARILVYECVVICVHFPRFYGKPRRTHVYIHIILAYIWMCVHSTRCTNGIVSSVFAFLLILPLLSPSHRICLYLILTLLISLHILPNSMQHICIFHILTVKYRLCAHSHHSTFHIILLLLS